MKEIQLTQGKVALVDDEDFKLVSQYKWYAHINCGNCYAIHTLCNNIYNERKSIKMHRIIMNAQKGQFIDHINGDTLNNQRSNLRLCTRAENGMNRKPNKNTSSKYKGVCLAYKKYWCASISINGKQTHLGRFKTEEEAAKKYNEKAIIHFGEFARLNVIE